jgi:hypothetical protein
VAAAGRSAQASREILFELLVLNKGKCTDDRWRERGRLFLWKLMETRDLYVPKNIKRWKERIVWSKE